MGFLEHYHESELEQFKFRFLSPAPLYKDFEIHQWAGGLKMSLKQLGTEDPFIRAALGDGEPDQFVQLLIENSSMDQVDFRTKLLEMDSLDFLEVDDPLIQWARKVVPIICRRLSIISFPKTVFSKISGTFSPFTI